MKVINQDGVHAPCPKVFITLLSLQKIKCFIDKCEYEVNGLGSVERNGNDFVIEDVFLIKQISSGPLLSVEFDQKAHSAFLYEWLKKYGDTSKLKFQWHSHANATAFFSPEDIDTIRGYMSDFMVSLVMNKYGEYKCRVDLYEPFHLSLETQLFIKVPHLSKNIVDECVREITEKIKVRQFLPKSPILNKENDEDSKLLIPIENIFNERIF